MKFFQDETHKSNVIDFLTKERRVYRDGQVDCYYLPAAFLLLSTNNKLYQKTRKYMSQDGIDFEAMMAKQDFSSGEAKLVRLAANLYNGSMEISPSEFIHTLDEENFDLAIQAIYFRRYGCHIESLLDQTMDDKIEMGSGFKLEL